jgi:superfamily II DNA or RNA helicase
MNESPLPLNGLEPGQRSLLWLMALCFFPLEYSELRLYLQTLHAEGSIPGDTARFGKWLEEFQRLGLVARLGSEGYYSAYAVRPHGLAAITLDCLNKDPVFANRVLKVRQSLHDRFVEFDEPSSAFETQFNLTSFYQSTLLGNAAISADAFKKLAAGAEMSEDGDSLESWRRMSSWMLGFERTRSALDSQPQARKALLVSAFSLSSALSGAYRGESLPSPDAAPVWLEYQAVFALLRGDLKFLNEYQAFADSRSATVRSALALGLLLSGRETEARKLLDKAAADCPSGALFPAGSSRFGAALVGSPFASLQAFWYILRSWVEPAKARSWFQKTCPLAAQSALIGGVFMKSVGQAEAVQKFELDMKKARFHPRLTLDHILLIIVLHWLDNLYPRDLERVEEYFSMLDPTACAWYRLELATVLSLHQKNKAARDKWDAEARSLSERTGIKTPLSSLFNQGAVWQRKLELLSGLKLGGSPDASPNQDERLVWLLNPRAVRAEPRLQKRLKNGNWSASKAISFKQLTERTCPALTPKDLGILGLSLKNTSYSSYLDQSALLPALAGHPLVFLEGAEDVQVDLSYEDIELRLEESGGQCVFSFSADPETDEPELEKTGPASYVVRSPSPNARKVAQIIGRRFEIPAEAKPQALEALRSVAGAMSVSSSLLATHRDTALVNADPRPLAQLIPSGCGMDLCLYVQPFGDFGPCLRPGEGRETLNAQHEGRFFAVKRDLKIEAAALSHLLARCPRLTQWLEESPYGDFDAEILEVEDSLEWPKGGARRVLARIGSEQARFIIRRDVDWFSAEGSVALGGNDALEGEAALDLGRLLSLIKESSGRFVRISDSEYVEIEAQFLRDLELLAAQAETPPQPNKPLRLSPLALASNGLLRNEDATQAQNAAAKEFRQRVKSAFTESYPVPTALKAELRDYQIDGYRWLRRMADCGAGLCLADDMGLGKTVQSLAFLLAIRKEGPSLAIVPTSVCANWIEEAARFAPALNVSLFGPGDRAQALAQLKAGDLLITSYGLLVSESEALASVAWNAVILDEAHAIKNLGTRRFKAACELKARARLALTGTPLQNRLGELWTLFEFLNPGYLGSKAAFAHRFVGPIEVENDERARRALKEMVKPFMLRRVKSAVLAELPEKTEISLAVELTKRERDYYELCRKKTVAEIAALHSEGTRSAEGKARFAALTGLTRLRRACCHPALAAQGAERDALMNEAPISSKIDALLDLLEEIRENGHRALVFSQFVDFLGLAREQLNVKGYAYEYLDGASSAKERKAAVDSFQTGETPFFLISLKAGGVGLNLTQADFVIHLDPWWNPAVEDQASDRAYRIGQTRPVTVYRLVAKDTVEEKIVELHGKKRSLSESLLEGGEAAASLGLDELFTLMGGEGVVVAPDTPNGRPPQDEPPKRGRGRPRVNP